MPILECVLLFYSFIVSITKAKPKSIISKVLYHAEEKIYSPTSEMSHADRPMEQSKFTSTED